MNSLVSPRVLSLTTLQTAECDRRGLQQMPDGGASARTLTCSNRRTECGSVNSYSWISMQPARTIARRSIEQGGKQTYALKLKIAHPPRISYICRNICLTWTRLCLSTNSRLTYTNTKYYLAWVIMVVAIVKRLIASVQLVGLNYMWFENLYLYI